MPANVTLSPATQTDVPNLARLAALAFQTDTHTLLKAQFDGETAFEDSTKEILAAWIESPRLDVIVAREEGRPVGFVCWGRRGYEPAAASVTDVEWKPAPLPDPAAAPRTIAGLKAINSETISHYIDVLIPPSSKCRFIVAISVLPSHQGKGVGTALMRWGTDRCDEENVYCWVSSSMGGWGAFEKRGFKEIARLDLDLDEFAEGAVRPGGEPWGRGRHIVATQAAAAAAVTQEREKKRKEKKDRKQQARSDAPQPSRGAPAGRGGGEGEGGRGARSARLRGLPHDSLEVRTSKTLSYVLRHGAKAEGLAMRADGYARVDDLLGLPKLRDLDLPGLQKIVADDAKGRYGLLTEKDATSGEDVLWIRANQGHSMKSVELELQPIHSVSDIPTGIAVHGTNRTAWNSIVKQGLSKMKRNHIHLAQGAPESGVLSGMRKSSEVLIYVDVQKALDAGIKFYLSANGVVLTEGDANGLLSPDFFLRVESARDHKPMPGFEGPASVSKAGLEAGEAIQDLEKKTEKLSVGDS